MVSQFSRASKPAKPYDDFPLFAHGNGQWAKKIRGKLEYFGPWEDWQAALQRYQDDKDDLYAGRRPPSDRKGLTVRDLCNQFLSAKQSQVETGEIRERTFKEYYGVCERIIRVLGKTRLVEDLRPEDFDALRKDIAKNWGLVSLANEIQRIRVVFNFAQKNGLVEKRIIYGETFKRPSKSALRAYRNNQGERMFEADQIRTMITAASPQLAAMIFLGINCGFGNRDCGTLPFSALDLENGWVNYPRPKTGIRRRCPLWPETVDAIRKAIAERPQPTDDSLPDLVFITSKGRSWAKDGSADNPLTKEMRKLLDRIDAEAEQKAHENGGDPPPKLYRHRIGFYALRHTFETIAGESRDQVAVDHIMGHARDDMASVYRERISDERLQVVVQHVYDWLQNS